MKFIFAFIFFASLSWAANPCSKEGEEWHPFLPGSGYKTCCKGLIGTSKWRSTQNSRECVSEMPGDSGFCVKCGDGKCDRALYEDECVCPKDCKANKQGHIPTH